MIDNKQIDIKTMNPNFLKIITYFNCLENFEGQIIKVEKSDRTIQYLFLVDCMAKNAISTISGKHYRFLLFALTGENLNNFVEGENFSFDRNKQIKIPSMKIIDKSEKLKLKNFSFISKTATSLEQL